MTEETTGQRRASPPGEGAAFAARYHLVRPAQGRYIAGVCGAIGRATRTDPVLWRVLLPVLTCFGGVGVLIYLGLWLLTPEEGDTGSPVEALLGRGQSSTPPAVVVLLAVLSGLVLVFVFPEPMHVLLLAGTALLAVALLLDRSRDRGSAPPAAGPPAAGPPSDRVPPDGPTAPGQGGPAATAAASPADTVTVPVPDADPTPEESGDAPADAAASPADAAPARAVPDGADGPPPAGAGEPDGDAGLTGGYRPPFAPHGPFAPRGPFAPPVPPPPPPPRVRRERSPLTAITFFAGLVVLGTIGALELSGVLDAPAAAYVAAALATVGVGLVVGAWLGRGRSLIVLGMVLALVVLPATHALDRWEPPANIATSVTWAPVSTAELEDEYEVAVGRGVLDLREVDFPPGETEIAARVTGGEMLVYLPPEVSVRADLDLRAGEAVLFGDRTDTTVSQVVEPGTGGDAGTLRLHLVVRFGHMEVSR